METNFKIYKNYAVQFGDSIFDLHNNFDFIRLDYNVADRTIVLSWQKNAGNWVPASEPSEINLVIEDVDFLHIFPREPDIPFSEDDCLMDWTYVSSRSRNRPDYKECVSGQDLPKQGDDVVFKFQSGLVVAVRGRKITAKINR